MVFKCLILMQKEEVDYQYPERTTKDTGILIPLNPVNIFRKSISKVKPRPRKVPEQMKFFKRYPCGDQKYRG